jgi:hypothetical protein
MSLSITRGPQKIPINQSLGPNTLRSSPFDILNEITAVNFKWG